MTAVLVVGTILTEIYAPQFVRWFVKGFSPDKIDLCIHLTRILLPARFSSTSAEWFRRSCSCTDYFYSPHSDR